MTKPRTDGFRMPGEFEPHAGCWMLWPERSDTWRWGGKPAQKAFSEVAKAIAGFEPLTVGVSHGQFQNARAHLPPEVRVVEISYDDAWIRDTGPTFVINDQGDIRGVDWEFNAWGGLQEGLYFPWDQDAMVAEKVLELERTPRYRAENFVLEGGSIHVDGQGTLITTEECLLHPNRNPHMDRADIEKALRDYLGVDTVIWLEQGIYNDETDGHVDNICCFIEPGVVALALCEDREDPQYAISRRNYEILKKAVDARGRKLEVEALPLPKPVLMTEEESAGVDFIPGSKPRQAGDRMAASYVNFLICNGGVIVPTFEDPQDEKAIQKLESLFPRREIVPIRTREIIVGGGNIHCITQQIPAP